MCTLLLIKYQQTVDIYHVFSVAAVVTTVAGRGQAFSIRRSGLTAQSNTKTRLLESTQHKSDIRKEA